MWGQGDGAFSARLCLREALRFAKVVVDNDLSDLVCSRLCPPLEHRSKARAGGVGVSARLAEKAQEAVVTHHLGEGRRSGQLTRQQRAHAREAGCLDVSEYQRSDLLGLHGGSRWDKHTTGSGMLVDPAWDQAFLEDDL